jgi:hypothetical protein
MYTLTMRKDSQMAHHNTKNSAADEKPETERGWGKLANHRAKHGDEMVFEAVAEIFMQSGGGLTVGRMLQLPLDMAAKVGQAMVDEVVKSIAPRDMLEKLLVEQLVFCHQRVQDLSVLASRQGSIKNKIAVDEQCNRAMTAYRRGFLALKQYRSQPAAVTAVTINQPEKQDVLLATGIRNSKNGSNELGANRNGYATADRC